MSVLDPSPTGIGASVRRLEDERFLVGKGRYTANQAVGDALHVLFLRSPYPHAEIAGIRTEAALQMRGVAAVYTGADVLADRLGHMPALSQINDRAGRRHREPQRLPISPDRVRHVGEIAAMVVAESLNDARDALAAVEVDYVELPVVVAANEALKAGAPSLHRDEPGNLMCDWALGDTSEVEAAFNSAAKVVRISQRFNRLLGNYLEPRSIAAVYDASTGQTTLTMPSQGAHVQQRLLCEVLKIPRELLRVVTPDVGGGFGPKFVLYPETVLLAWAARKLQQPLRWECERMESFQSDAHARDLIAEMALALDESGRFLAVKVEALANCGAYTSLLFPTTPTFGMAKVLSGLYRIPAMQISMKCVFTNTVPIDALRGAGKPETTALLEQLIDKAAIELGHDRVELRRKNFVTPDAFPYKTPFGYVYDSGNYPAMLDRALSLADFVGLQRRKQESRSSGKRRGLGIACHLHGSSGLVDETSSVAIRGGTIHASTGTQSQGQGHETAFAQILSTLFGVPYGHIKISQGDTELIVRGGGTGGSSSTIISANALRSAGRKVIAKGCDLAAEFMECSTQDISFRDGWFEILGTDRRIGIFEVAERAEAKGHRLEETADFADRPESWAAGIMCCEIEVDTETGAVRIDRFISVSDVGTVVNPMLVAGQIHGGIAMGIGQALLENTHYDDQSGQILAGSWMDYGMPRADDVPMIIVETMPLPSPNNPLGLKGVGELPTNGSPAVVASALVDALREYGISHIPSPATPEIVWQAIRRSSTPAV